MKKLSTFITEDADELPDIASSSSADAKKGTINFIVSNFYRFVNSSDVQDNKSLLMLIAALSVLNTSSDSTAIQAARRLTQMALVRRGGGGKPTARPKGLTT